MRRLRSLTCCLCVLALGVATAPAAAIASDQDRKRFLPAIPKPAPGVRAAALARDQLGVPYRNNGASPQTGFDCSGLVLYVFAELGLPLPHFSGAQWRLGRPVERASLAPGDLVFFEGLGHVGIYVGDGLFVHAPRSGTFVRIDSISSSWYATTLVGGRRIV